MVNRIFFIGAALICAGISPLARAQSWVQGSPPNDSVATTYFPYLATEIANVTYGSHNSSEKGDIYLPNYNGKPIPANASNRPAVIVVHGGGGTGGSRASSREIQMSQFLAAHGYVAFNIDYTLGAVWPKNVWDWRLAIRYLRANAATYGIDTNHIGVVGGSFGGFCAANLCGITNGQRTIFSDSNANYNNISLDGYSGEALNVYSGDVQCGLDLYGPVDQVTSGNASGIYSSPTTATLKNSSAIYYVHPTSAPLMIAHGTSDATVSFSQSQEITNYLGQSHVPYKFYPQSGLGHSFSIYQSSVDLRQKWMDFFDTYLLASSTPPYIQVQPANQTGCAGDSASFSVTAGGTAPLTYQWYGPSGAIALATNNVYYNSSLVAGSAGNYFVVITNLSGAVTSSIVTLTVNNLTPPSITNQPVDTTVAVGSPTSLSVGASGDALSYQWYLNSQPIANATNASYNLTSAANSDAGTYQVIVFNSCHAVASISAVLTVNGPPAITANPLAVTTCSGDTATFSATANGTAPLSYQWFGPSGAISGATTASVTLTNLTTANSGNYYLVVTNVFGSATSSNALLTVSAHTDVTFTTQPTNVSVNIGGAASFTVAVSGGGNYTYLWLKNDYDTITGTVATNATLVVSNLTLADSGTWYHCLVGNDCSIVSSANAFVTVNSANSASVVIAEIYGAGGKSTAIYSNDYVVLKNIGGAAQSLNGWSLQHQKAGVWQTPFALPNVSIPAGGYYLIKCFNDGSGIKGTAALPTPDASTSQTSAWNLSVTGSGAVALVSSVTQLTQNNTNVMLTTEAANIVDLVGYVATATTSSYIGAGTAPGGTSAGTNSTIRLSNGCQNTPDNSIDFTTSTPNPRNSATAPSLCGFSPPSIAANPVGQTNVSGTSLSLAVTANGSTPLNYFWFKNNAFLAGNPTANAALLNISPATTNDSGAYYVVITNFLGSVTSSIANVLITNLPPTPPTITLQPQSQSAVSGANVTFTAAATGSSPLAYQWSKDSSAISGATNSSLLISNVTLANAGNYSVTVTNQYGSATSSNAVLTVLNLGPLTNSVASSWATIRSSTNINADIDEATLGYLLIKYSANIDPSTASTGAGKSYLAFDLGGNAPDTNGPAEIDVNLAGSGGAQHVQLWALNQAFPGMTNSLTWMTAQANDTNSNSMLTNGAFTATLLLDTTAPNATTNTFVLPSNWARGVVSNRIVIAIVGVSDAANSSAGARISIATNLPLPTLRYYKSAGPAAIQFQLAYDAGLGLFGGENVIFTNTSGQTYYAWSSADPSLPVTSWTLEGSMNELPLGTSGNSRYGINLNPGASPVYYIFATTNGGPYLLTENLAWLTTDDYVIFNVMTTNMPISTNGIFGFASAPTISQNPADQTVQVGGNANFSVSASGSVPLFYQWRKGGFAIAAATNSQLQIVNVTTNDAGAYDVVVTNFVGSVTSSVAMLLISNPPPVITQQPAPKSLLAGQSVSFTVSANGTGLNYQWLFNNTNVSGANSAALVLNSVAMSQAGNYSVRVSNASGVVTSSNALLQVSPPPQLSVNATTPGTLQFTGNSITGLTYVVQQTTNLTGSWSPILTNNTGISSVINFSTNVTAAPGVFYRLMFP